MKFIHSADIHLGSPFKGLRKVPSELYATIINSTSNSFKKMIQFAITEEVDFICIVGDLFDNPKPEASLLNLIVEQFKLLQDHNIVVFLSFGNHDYNMEPLLKQLISANVIVFNNQVETKIELLKNGQKVSVTGFSYDNQSEHRSRINEYPDNDNQADFKIGMLHGSMDGIESPSANYAPFTKQNLLEKNYDYWALGHIHQKQILNENPIIQYSGNIQGRHINESGDRGFNLITVSNHEINSEFIKSQTISWVDLSVDARDDMTLDLLIDEILNQIENLSDGMHLINLIINHANLLNRQLLDAINDDLLLMRLQNKLSNGTQWIYRIDIHMDDKFDLSDDIDMEIWKQVSPDIFNEQYISQLSQKFMSYNWVSESLNSNETIKNILNGRINVV